GTRAVEFAILQNALPPVLLRLASRQQLASTPGKISEFANRSRWNETVANQTMAQQVSQPLAVLHICLPPGNVLDVSWICQHYLHGRLKHVEDGVPIITRALHHHLGTARFLQDRQSVV